MKDNFPQPSKIATHLCFTKVTLELGRWPAQSNLYFWVIFVPQKVSAIWKIAGTQTSTVFF